MERRRVAITGVGVAAPCGIGREAFWEGLHTQPEPGARKMADWDPSPYFDNSKDARRSDRFAQLALAAAAEAINDAGDLSSDPDRCAVLYGTGVGGIGTIEEQIIVNEKRGPRRVSPFLVPMMMPNAAAASISMRYGFTGACEVTTTACAAGTHSITNGGRAVATGLVDVAIVGGSEAAMTPTAVAGFGNMTALSRSGVSKPFDAERDGFVIAEGAGVLVLEEWETAVARGATILAEWLGGGSTADAHHITAPSPGGQGAIRCINAALAEAGLAPADIGHINAHGTSTPLNDAAEAAAIMAVFGDDTPPVTSIKGVTGHSLGAAGALEGVASVLSLSKRSIPPTVGTTAVDPEIGAIDLVIGSARDWEPAPILSNSFGFGGHNGTTIIGPA